MRVPVESLRSFCLAALRQAGLNEADADVTADALVRSCSVSSELGQRGIARRFET